MPANRPSLDTNSIESSTAIGGSPARSTPWSTRRSGDPTRTIEPATTPAAPPARRSQLSASTTRTTRTSDSRSSSSAAGWPDAHATAAAARSRSDSLIQPTVSRLAMGGEL